MSRATCCMAVWLAVLLAAPALAGDPRGCGNGPGDGATACDGAGRPDDIPARPVYAPDAGASCAPSPDDAAGCTRRNPDAPENSDDSSGPDRGVTTLPPAATPGPAADLSECLRGTDSDAVRRVAACTRAILANPGNGSVLVPAYLSRANLHRELRQWERVVGDCDEVLRLAAPGETRSTADGLRRVAHILALHSEVHTAGPHGKPYWGRVISHEKLHAPQS